MVPDRLAIVPGLAIRAFCNSPVQLQFTWNDDLRKITLADEIRDDADVFDCVRIKQKDRVAQTRLFFPKRTLHIGKNISTPDLSRVRQRRRARVRIHRRAMADNEKAVIGYHKSKVQQPALSASRMGRTPSAERPTLN